MRYPRIGVSSDTVFAVFTKDDTGDISDTDASNFGVFPHATSRVRTGDNFNTLLIRVEVRFASRDIVTAAA